MVELDFFLGGTEIGGLNMELHFPGLTEQVTYTTLEI